MESDFLTRCRVFGTGDQDAHSSRQERKGLPRLDSPGNHHLEHLGFVIALFVGIDNAAGGTRSIRASGAPILLGIVGRRGGNDSDAHPRPGHVGTRDHELLPVDRDGELGSSPHPLRNPHHEGGLLSGRQGLIRNLCHIVAVGGQFGHGGFITPRIVGVDGDGNLKALAGFGIEGASDADDAGAGVDLEFFAGFDVFGDEDAKDGGGGVGRRIDGAGGGGGGSSVGGGGCGGARTCRSGGLFGGFGFAFGGGGLGRFGRFFRAGGAVCVGSLGGVFVFVLFIFGFTAEHLEVVNVGVDRIIALSLIIGLL